jgi:hypothetical protein
MPRARAGCSPDAAERTDRLLHLAPCGERRNARHYLAMDAAGNARQIGRAQRVELGEPEALTEPLGREQLLLCDCAALI